MDFLKLLYDKLDELHGIFANTSHRNQFPRPLFKVVMLYVDEDTSIMRQLERAKLASVHNKRVLDAGAGQLWWVHATWGGGCQTGQVHTACQGAGQGFKGHNILWRRALKGGWVQA